MKKNFRTKVFTWAYEIAKATGRCFSICLSKAWALYRLRKAMQSGVVSFTYTKTDGTTREARGTLKGVQEQISGTGRPKAGIMTYFDADQNGWRCFKKANLIDII